MESKFPSVYHPLPHPSDNHCCLCCVSEVFYFQIFVYRHTLLYCTSLYWLCCADTEFFFFFFNKLKVCGGNSLAVQWLGLCAFTAEVPGSITGLGTKIPQAMAWPKKKRKGKESLWQPWIKQVYQHHIFPTAFAHFMCLGHILVIFTIFQTFSLLLYLLWWSVISDLWYYYCNCFGGPRTVPIWYGKQ